MSSESSQPSDPSREPGAETSFPSDLTDTAPEQAVGGKNLPPGDIAEEAASDRDAPEAPRRKVKIGTQRPGSGKVQATAQHGSRTVYREPKRTPVPNTRQTLEPEDELELAAALGEQSLDELLQPGQGVGADLEPETRLQARVITVRNDDLFLDLGGRNQGVMSLTLLKEPPQPGAVLEVMIGRFDAADGLYQCVLPGGSVDVGDWSQITEGMTVEARVTGHNKGGLEVEVSNIRGFIPVSQVSPYRVENLEEFVGQKLACVVTEANPERRNLVLSRRAAIERERAEAREQILEELTEGQVREGVVRSLQEFGAFVDLGGVDGLLHVSQLAWQRVKHPSEVLEVGQRVKVMVRKIEPQTGKISLSLKDLADDPWREVAMRYAPRTTHTGRVTRTMEFGAFVELEPGVEGLIHVSQLDHARVWRVSDVVKEGDQVDVQVLAVDGEQRRISLSRKAVLARPEPKKKEPELPEQPEPSEPVKKHKGPLKGGLGKSSGGDQFGLKW